VPVTVALAVLLALIEVFLDWITEIQLGADRLVARLACSCSIG